jgi:hypothetical protein
MMQVTLVLDPGSGFFSHDVNKMREIEQCDRFAAELRGDLAWPVEIKICGLHSAPATGALLYYPGIDEVISGYKDLSRDVLSRLVPMNATRGDVSLLQARGVAAVIDDEGYYNWCRGNATGAVRGLCGRVDVAERMNDVEIVLPRRGYCRVLGQAGSRLPGLLGRYLSAYFQQRGGV